MSENPSSEELAIGQRIRTLGEAGVDGREPHAVVRAVLQRAPRRGMMGVRGTLAASAGVLVLLVAFFALTSIGEVGSRPTAATIGGITVAGLNIGGMTYTVGAARSIDLSGARLTVYGEAHQNTGFSTEESTAYQLDDIDPRQVLVMKLIPGQRDDVGSIGDYLVLTRAEGYSLLCPYFIPGDPLAPSECH